MKKRAIVGILAGHEESQPNDELVKCIVWLLSDRKLSDEVLAHYQFLFTGGTFHRCFRDRKKDFTGLPEGALDRFLEITTVLPGYLEGGVVLLSQLLVRRRCSILWPFLSPTSTYLQNPDNGALLRLADYCHAKKLMNSGSVRTWLRYESDKDQALRSKQEVPLHLQTFGGKSIHSKQEPDQKYRRIIAKADEHYPPVGKRTIALIAHDQMKNRMIDFAVDYESQLAKYDRILATGTTGSRVRDATRDLSDKIHRCYSGPKGGDIEIAVEVLAGDCHDVVFFIDAVNPHPHMDDIRVVIGACMVRSHVQMLTNERHARAWMDNVFPNLEDGL